MKKIILVICILLYSINIFSQDGIVWNYSRMEQIRQQYKKKDDSYTVAVSKLLSRADNIYNKRNIPSVTVKKSKYVAKTLNDYVSLATYFWPNKKSKNALPYQIIDGKKNPEVNSIPDLANLTDFCERIKILSLAYYYTNDKKYSNKTNELLKAWFLNPKTKMNPHFNHAQYIKGKNTGRAEGIVDGRFLVEVIDGINLLEKQGQISKQDLIGIKLWFKEYKSWMENSSIGKRGATLKNNIGTSYYLQLACVMRFLGENNSLKILANYQLSLLLNNQFTSDGDQPLELRRASPIIYSTANLLSWAKIYNILNRDDLYLISLDFSPIKIAINKLEGQAEITNGATFRYIKKVFLSNDNLRKSPLKSKDLTFEDAIYSLTY